jgi:uncharacterized protein (TIGR04255 family)
MIALRELKNAPIKEAVIDFRVVLKEEIETEKLDSEYSLISNEYQKKETLLHGKFGLPFGESEPVSKTVNPIGYRYTSGDGKYVAQFRTDGFTLSRMEPYTVWNDVRSEAAKLWEIYCRVANVDTITRVATRYINVIRVPMDAIKDFGEYLVCPPELPKTLPQGISSFLSRIVFRDPDIEAQCILTQALEAADFENRLIPIILDIDAFIERPFPVAGDHYWQEIDKLRHFKNRVFRESITDKAEGLFQ